MTRFKDKVALVTGGSGGIGRASALAFAREGAKVVVSDIQVETGEETVALIKEAGGQAVFIRADVSNSRQVESLIEQTVRTLGGLHYAHNNAGIGGEKAPLIEQAEETWDKVIDINLKGVWLCMKYQIKEMLKNRSGAIVNTGSVSSEVGLSKYSPYCASKPGIIGLTKTAALEYIKDGIRVNAVCPGLIDTEMVERSIVGDTKATNIVTEAFQNFKKNIAQAILTGKQPSGRMGSAAEVAEAVIWLCSDSASYVNGHALAIDGGFLVK